MWTNDTQHNTQKLNVSQTLALTLITDNSDLVVIYVQKRNACKVYRCGMWHFTDFTSDMLSTPISLHVQLCMYYYCHSCLLPMHSVHLTPVIIKNWRLKHGWLSLTHVYIYIHVLWAPTMKLIHHGLCIVWPWSFALHWYHYHWPAHALDSNQYPAGTLYANE